MRPPRREVKFFCVCMSVSVSVSVSVCTRMCNARVCSNVCMCMRVVMCARACMSCVVTRAHALELAGVEQRRVSSKVCSHRRERVRVSGWTMGVATGRDRERPVSERAENSRTAALSAALTASCLEERIAREPKMNTLSVRWCIVIS